MGEEFTLHFLILGDAYYFYFFGDDCKSLKSHKKSYEVGPALVFRSHLSAGHEIMEPYISFLFFQFFFSTVTYVVVWFLVHSCPMFEITSIVMEIY